GRGFQTLCTGPLGDRKVEERPARPCREVGEGGQGEKRTQNKNIHRTTSKIRRCVERRFSEARCKAGLHCGVHRTARPDRRRRFSAATRTCGGTAAAPTAVAPHDPYRHRDHRGAGPGTSTPTWPIAR